MNGRRFAWSVRCALAEKLGGSRTGPLPAAGNSRLCRFGTATEQTAALFLRRRQQPSHAQKASAVRRTPLQAASSESKLASRSLWATLCHSLGWEFRSRFEAHKRHQNCRAKRKNWAPLSAFRRTVLGKQQHRSCLTDYELQCERHNSLSASAGFSRGAKGSSLWL